MGTFFQLMAYRFDSKLKIREMISILNQVGLWRFIERDNDRHGVYTSSIANRPKIARVCWLQ